MDLESTDSGIVSEDLNAADGVSSEIKETDIVFDCVYCGKSLAIDYRGAGLNIPCSDCGKMVEVPIPEGMDIGDIDKSDQEMEIVVLNLRKSLSAAELRISELEEDLHEVESRRDGLEKQRADVVFKFGAIAEQVSLMQKSMDDIADSLRRIGESVK